MPPRKRIARRVVKYPKQRSDQGAHDQATSASPGHPSGEPTQAATDATDEEGTDDEYDGQDSDDSAKPVKKRQRTAPSKGKGRVAKLQYFQAIPMDLLFEITSHLDPHTLLNMSRVNKFMHQVFTSPSAASTWQATRRNVNLPELEAADLTDTQYATLIYERECHVCKRGRAVLVDYALRVRWCKACRGRNLMLETKVRANIGRPHPSLIDACLYTYNSITGRNVMNKRYYSLAGAKMVNTKLWALHDAGNPTGVKDLVQEGRQQAALSIKDGHNLTLWANRVAAEKAQEVANAGSRREADIVRRLVSLGYDKRDCSLFRLRDLVRKPAPLTEAAWLKIKPQVIAAAEAEKAARIHSERSQQLRAARGRLEPFYEELKQLVRSSATFPVFHVFAQLPSVRQFWVPEDVVITREAWDQAQPAIAADLEKAHRYLRVDYSRRVLEILRNDRKKVDETLEVGLAIPVHKRGSKIYSSDPVDRDYEFAFGEADLDDLAPDVTDSQLDSLLSRFSSLYRCGGFSCGVVLPFPAIHEHTRDVCGDGWPEHGPFLFRQLDALRCAAGLPDHVDSLDALRALGPVFSCHNCGAKPPNTGYPDWRGQGQTEAPAPPHMTLDRLLAHTVARHPYDYPTEMAEMRLETVEYGDEKSKQ